MSAEGEVMVIGVIGMGLIGGSIAKAAKKYVGCKAYCFDIDGGVNERALAEGIADELLDSRNILEAELIAIALKEGDTLRTLEGVLPYLPSGATVMDVCGNKRCVTELMRALQHERPDVHFVGIHPMAGREYSGLTASTAELFKGAFILAVPIDGDVEGVATAKKFFLAAGARRIVECDAQTHDRMIAYTSQLAHIASSSYVKNPLARESFGFYAGSFLDLTRVARLNVDMWTELFLNNRDNLTEDIDDMISRLKEYRRALEEGDAESLRALLKEGADIKEEITARGNDDNQDLLRCDN